MEEVGRGSSAPRRPTHTRSIWEAQVGLHDLRQDKDTELVDREEDLDLGGTESESDQNILL